MCRVLSFLVFISIAQFTNGQKSSNSNLSDDLIISNQRVSPFSLDKTIDSDCNPKVTHSDTYILDRAILDALTINAPESLMLSIPMGTSIKELLLRKINITSEKYLLRTSSGTERSLPLDLMTYSGIVDGTNDRAVVTLSKHKIYVIISTENGNYEINPSQTSNTYIGHYAQSRTNINDWNCETEDDRGASSPTIAGTRSGDCIEVYLECDFTTYQDNGSNVTDTETWVINMMNSVISLYNDIDVPLVVSEVFIWDTTDPYLTETTLTTLRNAFMDAIQDGYNGRIAKLISTREIGGGLSNGIGGLCGSYGDFPSPYAVSTSLDPNYSAFPTYSYNIYVIAHEIGHIIGARHTHACVWNGDNTQIDDCGNVDANDNSNTPEGLTCYDIENPILPSTGTIMSKCNLIPTVGIDFANGFHPLVAAEMQSNFIDADCSTGSFCATVTPSNDNCLGAIELTAYDICNPSIFDNYLATESGILPSIRCGNSVMSLDVWFRVLIPASGSITIETTDDGTLDDMTIQTYTGDCNALVRSVCNENDGVGDHALAIHAGLTPGDYLYIRVVDAGDDDEGTFGLCAYDAPLDSLYILINAS